MTIFRIVLPFGKGQGDRVQKRKKTSLLFSLFHYLSSPPLFNWSITADHLWLLDEILSLLIHNLRSTHPHIFLSFLFESEGRAVPGYFSSDSCREWKMLLVTSFDISLDRKAFLLMAVCNIVIKQLSWNLCSHKTVVKLYWDFSPKCCLVWLWILVNPGFLLTVE